MGERSDENRKLGAAAMDELYLVLRNRERRYALYLLLECGAISTEELADAVTGWTRAATYGMASRRVRDQVHLGLKHRHLPAMVEAGLVACDDGTVSIDPCPGAARGIIRVARRQETTTNRGGGGR